MLYVLVLACVCVCVAPWEGRAVAGVQLQSVLQWISPLHLFKGSAERGQELRFSVQVSDPRDAARLHTQQRALSSLHHCPCSTR